MTGEKELRLGAQEFPTCISSVVHAIIYVPSAAVSTDTLAPVVDKMVNHPAENIVPGEYLVTVEPNTDC